jgi:hypothetical protein
VSDQYLPDLSDCGMSIQVADVKRSPAWHTEVVEYETGFTQRNRVRLRPMMAWELRLRLITETQYLDLLDFWHQHSGAFEAFWFNDWTEDDPVQRTFATAAGANTRYKLPHDAMDSATIYVGGVADPTATVDLTTGVVTFAAAPAEDVVLSYSATNARYRTRFAEDMLPADVRKFLMYGAELRLAQVAIGNYDYWTGPENSA